MSIKVKRKTGIFGVIFDFKVFINGEEVERIQNNEIIDIEIPDEEAVIQLSQLGVKTNEVSVEDGDYLEVSTNVWGIYSIFAIILLLSMSRLFVPDVIRYGVLLLYFVSAFFINGMFYKVEKVLERVKVSKE